MKNISVSDIYKNIISINQYVKILGWVKNRRHSKLGISFIDIYDGSCFNIIQAVVHDNLINYQSEVLQLTIGCSVCVYGTLILSKGKKQKFEIQVQQIKILGWVENPSNYPIAAKNNTYTYLRDIPHLRPRTNFFGVVTRIRHHLFQIIHQFFHKKNFYWIPTPIITSLDAEGAGSMFRVSTLQLKDILNNRIKKIDFKNDFFGKEAFLTVSGQLTAEAYACAMTKVYTFGPTFRAENSNTTRHLSEFWMLEVEQSFCNLDDIIDFVKKFIKHVIIKVLKDCKSDMNFLYEKVDKNIFNKLEKFISNDIIEINYSDAIKILQNSQYNFQQSISYGLDLSTEHEKYLVDNYFYSSIIIKNYPKSLKAFYMRLNDDQNTVSGMDLLVPGIGEILGGSQREERKDFLKSRLLESELNMKDYSWYIDLRRYGTVPHSGFGLGFERLLSYITGVKNIRDLIPFPRTVNHALC